MRSFKTWGLYRYPDDNPGYWVVRPFTTYSSPWSENGLFQAAGEALLFSRRHFADRWARRRGLVFMEPDPEETNRCLVGFWRERFP